MAYKLLLLGIAGIGICWFLKVYDNETEYRKKENNIIDMLIVEIKKLRQDIDEMKK